MRPRGSAKMRGFTLVEVMVSTVLLASVFVAVLSLSSQSLHNLLRLEPHEIALVHARERMNGLLLLEEIQPGEFSGSWKDGYRWTALIAQHANDTKSARADYQLFDIRVVISWGDRLEEKNYVLETRQWAKMVKQNASR
ncbi:MAG TPA: prepilin-type N-terminal cleavage/methylation domain-containing protein [Candidatus Acidoferrum sp.]|jgi:prepilin-type N-terminal cleavage/methylation domain-containing protein|nr:prepilin-type N-terminal cleavage/methylation domain-containing protein [Candidatus Acidoferrum sp.]